MTIDYANLRLVAGPAKNLHTGKVATYAVTGLPSPLYAEIKGGGQQWPGYQFFLSESGGTPLHPLHPPKSSSEPKEALEDLKQYLLPKYPNEITLTKEELLVMHSINNAPTTSDRLPIKEPNASKRLIQHGYMLLGASGYLALTPKGKAHLART